MTIEYDGRNYAGFQRQGVGTPTVQHALEQSIHAFCQQDIVVFVAGRTDAGVHARGQVAHFDLDYGDRPLTGYDLASALNAHLKIAGHAVSIVSAEAVAAEFHARFSATNKLYCYRLINRSAPPAIDSGHVWHIRRLLDVDAMRAGAVHLLGNHDFTTFRDSECQAKSPIKTLNRLDIDVIDYDGLGGREIRFLTEGRSFLHHQVRNMVGTLTMVGEGKWTPGDVKTALMAKDRAKGGPTAPPDGLYLMRVDY